MEAATGGGGREGAEAGRGGEQGTDTPASPCGASRAASAAMAGSEPRKGGVTPQPHHSDWSRLEAAILSGWRNFWQSVGKERAAPRSSPEEADEKASSLTRLPVSVGRHPRRTAGRAGRGARRGGLWGPRRGRGEPPWARPVSGPVPAAIPGSVVTWGQQLSRNALALTRGAPQLGRRSPRNSPAGCALATSQVTLRSSTPKTGLGTGAP